MIRLRRVLKNTNYTVTMIVELWVVVPCVLVMGGGGGSTPRLRRAAPPRWQPRDIETATWQSRNGWRSRMLQVSTCTRLRAEALEVWCDGMNDYRGGGGPREKTSHLSSQFTQLTSLLIPATLLNLKSTYFLLFHRTTQTIFYMNRIIIKKLFSPEMMKSSIKAALL